MTLLHRADRRAPDAMRRAGVPLWRFSLRLYGAPGVAKACLEIQDRHGADVNLLLYCCWMGMQGRQLSARGVRSAMSAVAFWQSNVVRPLRRARRAAKEGDARIARPWRERLRRRIGAAELDAEFVEHLLLYGQAMGVPPPAHRRERRAAAAVNLKGYLKLLGAAIGRREARRLGVLLDASCSLPAAVL